MMSNLREIIQDKDHESNKLIELHVFDNDGPEGNYEVIKFHKSFEAVNYILKHYKQSPDFEETNFEIKNNYK